MPCKIKKRGKEEWLAAVTKRGVRKQRIFSSRVGALAWEAEMRKSWKPDRIDGDSLTVLEWANAYLDYSAERVVSSVLVQKKLTLKRFLQDVGHGRRVDEVTSFIALKFLGRQARERTGGAANNDRKHLAKAWEYGTKYLGLPRLNPFAEVDKFPERKKDLYVPSLEDFNKVLQAASGQDQVMLVTFLNLAARRSEVLRLKWGDIDFANEKVRLWTRKRRGGNLESDLLPLTVELKRALLWWWENQPAKREFVFTNQDPHGFNLNKRGKPFSRRSEFMARLCALAGVKAFGFHAIRHLTASALYQAGVPVTVIQELLRHQSPMTTTRYLHKLGDGRVKEVLEQVIGDREKGKILPLHISGIGGTA